VTKEDKMLSTNVPPVVAGVDGSADARLAADLAAWEADRRHAPLRLVAGFQPAALHGMVVVGYDLEDQERELADVLVAEAARIRQRYPELAIATEVVSGAPAGVLVEESASASLVVVGSRGLGGFAALLAGSVSAQVAAHAKAPVIVVRPPAARGTREIPGTGPVLVGVDGSTGSAAAVGFAFEEAAARGSGLLAVYAWGVRTFTQADNPQLEQWAADEALAEAVSAWAQKYPEVHVERRAIHSLVPVHTILDESGGASLIVVGPRGRGGFAGLLLGSVGDGLVRHAATPVAVVHTTT
jgi:nucleotide-binding universal stress UspA family protein